MKKTAWLLAILTIILCAALAGCSHTHSFSQWEVSQPATCTEAGIRTRYCNECEYSETEPVSALGHTSVEDPAVAPDCVTEGMTLGSHCSVCNTVLVAQRKVSALGHTVVTDAGTAATCTQDGISDGSHCSVCETVLAEQVTISATGHTTVEDPAVEPTCTADGLTEGSHCAVCETVLVAQETVPKKAHLYTETISQQANCQQSGILLYSCEQCNDSYTEVYGLPQFSATEIYNAAIEYVGEIHTYDKLGRSLAIGTGFVYSEDGKIITNYHVILGAYSAQITISGVTYPVTSVLAYDETIDLAVLQIDAAGLTVANICKLDVVAGQTVFAMGSSLGLTNTCSQGIITSATRESNGVTYIQHNAAISQGNSGGPLINAYGEVIGINTMTFDDSQNLNFAVFAKELDNLKYGTPMTLPEFYDQEMGTPCQRLAFWLIQNGTADDESEYYVRDYFEYDGYQMIYELSYDSVNGYVYALTAYYGNDGIEIYTILYLSDPVEAMEYYGYYYDGDELLNYATGSINAKIYTLDTVLTSNTYEGLEGYEDTVLNEYDLNIQEALWYLEQVLLVYEMDLTIRDYGFESYVA